VRRELIQTLTPTMTSWMAQCDPFLFNPKCLDPSADARRFEGGSPAIPNIYLARPAIDLLAGIGMDNVAAQIERLTRAFLKGVCDLRIDSKTPSSSVGPLVVLRANRRFHAPRWSALCIPRLQYSGGRQRSVDGS
jgi:selenocysteine lyase/cysteine desulfurase